MGNLSFAFKRLLRQYLSVVGGLHDLRHRVVLNDRYFSNFYEFCNKIRHLVIFYDSNLGTK